MSVWILIRHGESVANSAKYLSGWQDVPLTDKGRTDAINLRPTFQALLNQLKQKLGEDAKVQMISSDLQRAVQTGMLVSGNEQIIQDKSFRERHFGIHQGSLKSDLRENGIMNQILSWTCDNPQIESFQQLANRVLPAMETYNSEIVVLFAHGGVIRMILGLLEGSPLEETARRNIPNTEPYIIKRPERGWIHLIPRDPS